MGVKGIHSFVFLFMAAITANMAHVVIAHEDEACEVCLHIHSTDDSLVTTAETEFPAHDFQTSIHDIWAHCQFDSEHIIADPIRGPPQFS